MPVVIFPLALKGITFHLSCYFSPGFKGNRRTHIAGGWAEASPAISSSRMFQHRWMLPSVCAFRSLWVQHASLRGLLDLSAVLAGRSQPVALFKL